MPKHRDHGDFVRHHTHSKHISATDQTLHIQKILDAEAERRAEQLGLKPEEATWEQILDANNSPSNKGQIR